MAEPTRFDIVLRTGMWVLTRDGEDVHEYGHVERAVHEATRLARELEATGEPSTVRVQTANGAMIEVAADPEPPAAEEPPGADRSALNPAIGR
jgi:hypothetical protein